MSWNPSLSSLARETREARLVAIALLALLAWGVGCGPTLVFPGGKLDGTPKPVPADWDFVESVSTIQLETRPADPYSVNIWAVGIGDVLYVHAGASRASWVENMEADPRVRVGIDDGLYELSAERVVSAQEFAVFAERYEKKYGNRPRNENIEEIYLFRLAAR